MMDKIYMINEGGIKRIIIKDIMRYAIINNKIKSIIFKDDNISIERIIINDIPRINRWIKNKIKGNIMVQWLNNDRMDIIIKIGRR